MAVPTMLDLTTMLDLKSKTCTENAIQSKILCLGLRLGQISGDLQQADPSFSSEFLEIHSFEGYKTLDRVART